MYGPIEAGGIEPRETEGSRGAGLEVAARREIIMANSYPLGAFRLQRIARADPPALSHGPEQTRTVAGVKRACCPSR